MYNDLGVEAILGVWAALGNVHLPHDWNRCNYIYPIVCVCGGGGGGEFVKQCVVCCFFLRSLARPCVFFFSLIVVTILTC